VDLPPRDSFQSSIETNRRALPFAGRGEQLLDNANFFLAFHVLLDPLHGLEHFAPGGADRQFD
jgi:hypothetical protein